MPADDNLPSHFFEVMQTLFETSPDPPGEEEGAAAVALRMVLYALEEGLAPPEWAALAVMAAMARYDSAEVATLGEAFEFPARTHLAARRTELMRASISFEVDRIQEEGRKAGAPIPLRSSRDKVGALEQAGNKFNISAATVAKYRESWRKQCKQCGRDPKAQKVEQSFANAGEEIARTLARGLRPGK